MSNTVIQNYIAEFKKKEGKVYKKCTQNQLLPLIFYIRSVIEHVMTDTVPFEVIAQYINKNPKKLNLPGQLPLAIWRNWNLKKPGSNTNSSNNNNK